MYLPQIPKKSVSSGTFLFLIQQQCIEDKSKNAQCP